MKFGVLCGIVLVLQAKNMKQAVGVSATSFCFGEWVCALASNLITRNFSCSAVKHYWLATGTLVRCLSVDCWPCERGQCYAHAQLPLITPHFPPLIRHRGKGAGSLNPSTVEFYNLKLRSYYPIFRGNLGQFDK